MSGILTKKGAATTFSRTTTVQNPDGTITSAVTTIPGHAMEIAGLPDIYLRLNLIESASPTLLFRPSTRGDRIKEGDTCVWGGTTYTARDCTHLAMAGTVEATRVVVVA